MGIPVIVNVGVGDVEETVNNANAGYVLHDFKEEDFKKAVDAIPSLLQKQPADIRKAVENVYSLERGIQLYRKSYQQVFS